MPVALWAVLMVRYVVYNLNFAVDDSYITFRYAEHFSLGHGLVFNVGERYYGTTAAGYAALLGLVRGVTRALQLPIEVPLIANCFSAIGLSLIGGHVAHKVWGLARQSLAAAAVVCCFTTAFVFMAPMSSLVPGHETYWFVGLLAAGLSLYFDLSRPAAGMAVLLLAATTRPDGVLMMLLVWALGSLRARGSRAELKRITLINAAGACGLGVWLLVLFGYYGQFLPGTMAAKHALYTTGFWTPLDWRVIELGLAQYLTAGWPMIIVVSTLTIGLASFSRWAQSPQVVELAWLSFGLVSVGFYATAEVIYCSWYVIPACFALFASGVRSVAWWSSFPGQAPGSTARVWAVALVLAAAVSPRATEGMFAFFSGRQFNGHLVAYQAVIDYLRRVEPAGTSVAIAEPGSFGFQLGPEYSVIDVLGLSSPGVAAALLKHDWGFALRTFQPKYLVVTYGMPFGPDRQPDFSNRYEKVETFYAPADNSPVGVTLLYRALAPAK